jgi:hypothetical protein
MGCSLLESVTIKNPNPPTLGDEYVFDYNAEGRKIHIPWGSYDLYVMDPIWMLYADSLEGI